MHSDHFFESISDLRTNDEMMKITGKKARCVVNKNEVKCVPYFLKKLCYDYGFE